MWTAIAVGTLLAGLAALFYWRRCDRRSDEHAREELQALAGATHRTYDPTLVRDLPEPARRYFNFMIEPGAALRTVVELRMGGELGLGTKEAHRYNSMRARQLLAPPYGLVWQVESGPLSGSDCALPTRSWTRFWLLGLLPVARVAGTDHHRSAFGRVIAEAAIWVPASLLPGEFVQWVAVDDDSARAIVRYGELEQAVDITVDDDGAPVTVIIQRWSNENPDKEYREQPFGGELSGFRQFDGYRLPTRVLGGNHFGTIDYFPFFKADVTGVSFPPVATKP